MKFNIATDQGIYQVEGELITIAGFKCFKHWSIDDDCMSISEMKSGMKIADDDGVTYAKQLLDSTTPLELEKWCKGKLRHAGLNYPIN